MAQTGSKAQGPHRARAEAHEIRRAALAGLPLKGVVGDMKNVILSGARHNIREILARLRAFWVYSQG